MDQSIVKPLSVFDSYLLGQPNKKREPNVVYVTDLTKGCMLQAYLDIVEPKPYEVSALRIFEAGRAIEDLWVRVLEKSPGFSVVNTQLMARWNAPWGSIHGRVDALVQHSGGSLVVHEVKSIKSLAFMNGRPKPEHEAQCQFYLGALNVEFGQIDYISKENLLQGLGQVEQCYPLRRDPAAFAALVHRGEELAGYLARGECPPATVNWACNGYCNQKGARCSG